MAVELPDRAPDISLVLPEPGEGYTELPFDGDDALQAFEGQFDVGTDARGRFMSPSTEMSAVNLGRVTAPPAVVPVRAVWLRVVAELPVVGSEEGASSSASAFVNLPSISLDADVDSGGESWQATYSPGVAAPAVDARPVGLADHRIALVLGEPLQWEALDVYEGAGSPGSGSGDVVPYVETPFMTNVSLSWGTALGIAPPRLYRFDVWFEPLGGGMWTHAHRHTPGGNSGGWPAAHRNVRGFTGAWPLRQRQTGL